MRNIAYRIKRFDGEHMWHQTYTLPYEKGSTILSVLIKIREEYDPTLNFTSACRSAICGSCAIRINGQAFLVCKTPLDDILDMFKTDELLFEPLGHFEVVRDLVVDWEPKFEKMKRVKPWLIPKEEGSKEEGFVQSEQDFHRISSSADCILCGVCASECSQLDIHEDGYLDPFILNRAYRFAKDTRDADSKGRIRAALDHSLWKCVHCHECVTKCPKDINLAGEIAELRQMTMKMDETKNLGARHAYAFHDDVKRKGRLNETMLPVKTEGVLNTVKKRVPFAMRMVLKGKMNPLHMPKEVEGIEDVRKIYEYVKAGDKS
ncbi:succinate dehydrogenase/fumarate reductase iron-sulfur subunit [Bacillus sonorensis]|uniref:succinate dehydrogenase/fumarate reductase iron-sulfur subunit n=1 Tax=Bacillus sonorensis TaxID=119858 RepID=UPI0022801919|nr:succinate dehydrogenase/fumarate reductase iron-sulfur subunit [Bacillus sonorensis]MCY7859150.1 succinate dehydrogenase/fumarate reductase iron-sulfur subunit [Bacillus sonorensis]MCY8273237.1 succinate dehydrogenase/fumarate reductase iron-sulfur subunit [Bacillus sonorensis]MCY8605469.1 succinate dehydrogenase/fumarate reductase iron-sulfur subunit [Bacillus sonorensis]